MSVLQFHKITKYFADHLIVQEASFAISEGEKVALAGINGSGKTTIFKIIAGIYEPDEGSVFIANACELGYSEQNLEIDPEAEIFDYVVSSFSEVIDMRKQMVAIEDQMKNLKGEALEATLGDYAKITEAYEKVNGYGIEAQTRRVLSGLGIKKDMFDKKCRYLSGGEQRRVSLARLLVSEPEILLLDEPTNHLDLPAIEWLEDFLQNYLGAVFVISHDRYFLDKVVGRVLEISQSKILSFPGNFTNYEYLKKEKNIADKRAFDKQQKEVRSIQDYIRKYKAGIKSKQARGREKHLARRELLEDVFTNPEIRLSFTDTKPTGKEVLKVEGLRKTIHKGLQFRDLSFLITTGQKVGIIGENGTGKTSLITTIFKETQDKGFIKWGSNVKASFFDQQHGDLHPDNTVFQEISNHFSMTIEKIKTMLAAVGFREDDLEKKISMLSGGEKSRVAFVKMILENPNLMFLDEPTNHLDLESKEIMIQALLEFEGTILFVSHDRFLLDVLATDIMVVDQGKVTFFNGNYSEYLENKKREEKAFAAADESKADTKKTNKKTSGINEHKIKSRIKELEVVIGELELQRDQTEKALQDQDSYQDFKKCAVMAENLKATEDQLTEALDEWMELTEMLEKFGK